ncbi:MAG: hypothetical protein Hyperionvirus4_60 [Hyperionvirus sp.]|uniref:Uncharacterized protein n=1 Tax=Hyperionvirus sp. TaxID=2487770 RepID=A0A3G5A787_9VIRU|nr:MAG: hypothetical protein Hyperionvirus4_60 [Hyperionvirus sp.]
MGWVNRDFKRRCVIDLGKLFIGWLKHSPKISLVIDWGKLLTG